MKLFSSHFKCQNLNLRRGFIMLKRSFYRLKLFHSCLVIILSMVILMMADLPAANVEKEDIFESEIAIMQQIIKENLDRAEISRPWKRFPFEDSLLESPLRSEYIPTVGAIFTIRLSFPIKPPEKSPVPEKTPATTPENEDLWDRFSGRKPDQKPEQPPASTPPSGSEPPQDLKDIRMDANPSSKDPLPSKLSREVKKLMDNEDLQKELNDLVENLRVRTEQEAMEALSEANRAIREANRRYIESLKLARRDAGVVDMNYSKEDFNAVRNAVIESVARYGWRMKSVKKKERILVILEAPSQVMKDSPVTPGGEPRDLSNIDDPGVLKPSVSFGDSFDHLLIAIDKSDLEKEINPGDLEQLVNHIWY